MSHNVEEQLQTKQFIQYQLNKEDLETVLGSLVEKIISRYEAAKREPRLTIKQVSQRLNVDPSTLWRWERDGYLIPTRLGRKVLYNESDIIAIRKLGDIMREYLLASDDDFARAFRKLYQDHGSHFLDEDEPPKPQEDQQ